MKNLKIKSNWYITLVYFFNSAIVVPVLFIIIMMFISMGVALSLDAQAVIGIILLLAMIPLGVMFASKYIYSHYVISDPKFILNKSSLLFLILDIVLFFRFTFLFAGWTQGIPIFCGALIILSLLFYFSGRKALVN